MTTTSIVKKALTDLVSEGIQLGVDFRCPKDPNVSTFAFDYQAWYSKALPVVRRLAVDRYDEFKRYYEPDSRRKVLGYGTYVIHDYIMGVVPSRSLYPDFDAKSRVAQSLSNQVAVLYSIVGRIDSVLADIESHLFADLKDAELATATALLKISPRAAGSLAGVVLEAHLQRVAANHAIKIAKKAPTIADLNDPLKQEGVYETSTWRKVGYLADLRNICSHKKDTDPTAAQVMELIEGVIWAVKTIT